MENKDFAVFILTHGRPNNIKTISALKRTGYTGKIYFIIDDQDDTADQYYANFGEQVIMFSKEEIAKTFDEGFNSPDRNTIIYARNACFSIAQKLGITYFMQLDDDYTGFSYKFDGELNYKDKQIKNLDAILDYLLEFYKSIPALSIAIAQGGDYIGGSLGSMAKAVQLRRKCMNSFICSTERPFHFVNRFNEDVTTYTTQGGRGDLFFTIMHLALNQTQTQSNDGGITDFYRKYGTYVKSFSSVLYCPSSIRVSEMGNNQKRLHHKINWGHTVPVILDPKYKKSDHE